MKRSILFAFVATMMFASAATAGSCCTGMEKCKHKGKMNDKTHYLMLGGAMVENGAVNRKLKDMGYSDFSRYGVSLGFGGISRHGRYMSGGEFEGLFWKRHNSGNTESRFSAGRFLSLHGLSLVSTPNVSLYPLVGIGGGVTSLWAGPKEVKFDSAFAVPSKLPESSPLHQLTFLIDAGFGMHFSRPLPHDGPGRMTIGLRAGYIFDPVDNDRWYRNSVRLGDGPNSDLSGPYVRLTLGGSGMGKHGKGKCCPYQMGGQGGKGQCCPHQMGGTDAKGPCCPHQMRGADGKGSGCPHQMKAMEGKEPGTPHQMDSNKKDNDAKKEEVK